MHGDQLYIGEPVSMTEHMLQAAQAAELDGASPTLVAAALLHDFGHLIHDLPEDSAEHGIDTRHKDVGADYLARHFVPAVVEPTRLHVAAKRYLCAVDPAYLANLSPASILSLKLQGGPYTAERRGPLRPCRLRLRQPSCAATTTRPRLPAAKRRTWNTIGPAWRPG